MKEREQHLPDYCLYTSLEQTDHNEKITGAFGQHCGFHQLKKKHPLQLMEATVLDESSGKLSTFIVICLLQRCLQTVVR